MKITLVRHGQTEANYEKIIQGLENIPLNDTGRRQCKKLREKLADKHYDVCYMSPLLRTVETAIILIGERVKTIPDKRIVDRNMGDLEGKENTLYDAHKYWDYDINCTDNNIEGVREIFDRCRDFLDYVIKKHNGKDILIVSHSAPIRAMRHLLLKTELKGNLLDKKFENCYCEEFELKE